MFRSAFLVFLILLSGATTTHAVAGKLDETRKEVRKEKTESNDDDSNDTEFWESVRLFFLIVVGPYVLANEYLDEGPAWFNPYPYSDGMGNMVVSDQKPADCQGSSTRVSAEYGWESEDVSRVTGNILWESASGGGVGVSWSWLEESLPGGETDHLSFVEPHAFLRYVQGSFLQMRVGGGALFMADAVQTDFGWSFSNYADFFPGSKFVVSAGISIGGINGSFAMHGKLTAGYMIQRWEIYSGYDYRGIGSVSFKSFTTGVRVWF